jgi:hypothetical protein
MGKGKNQAADLARSMAQKKSRSSIPRQAKVMEDNKRSSINFTTFDELTEGFKTAIVKVNSGKFEKDDDGNVLMDEEKQPVPHKYVFEIQSIDPGEFAKLLGTPIIALLADKGVNVADEESLKEGITRISEEEAMEVASDGDFQSLVRQVLVAGIVNVNFTLKKQAECSTIKKEVSVDILAKETQMELYVMIMDLSLPERVEKSFTSFRGQGAGEEPA